MLLRYLLLLLIIFSLIRCQDRVNGCLDPFATNYDISADDPCEDCCTSQSLTINFRIQVDSMSFMRDSAYSDGDNDTLLLNQVMLLLSEFKLLDNQSAEIEVTNRLTGDNYDIADDLFFVNSGAKNQSVIEFSYEGTIEALKFKFGMPQVLEDGTINIEDDEEYQEIRDSLYDSSNGRFTDMRLAYLNQDSLSFAQEINGLDDFQFEFKLEETSIIRGSSLSATINFNLDSIWKGISMFNDNEADIQEQFISNLPSSVSLN